MSNRGFSTHGKECRRLRLWLKPETWRLLEMKEAEKAWPSDDNSIVELILDSWADAILNPPQLNRANCDRRTGPVELGS